jgi:hypothetical protein
VPVEEPSTASQADICGAANEALFDHLVGQREQGGWDCKAECFGGLQVDEKVELIRQHYPEPQICYADSGGVWRVAAGEKR